MGKTGGKWAPFLVDVGRFQFQHHLLVCPICQQSEAQVRLTDGHVYAAMCRTKAVIVPECESCNSNLGSAADAAVNMMAASLKFAHNELDVASAATLFRRQLRMTGAGHGDARAISGSAADGRIGIEFGFCGDQLPHEDLDDGSWNLRMRFQSFHHSQIVAGLLHSGFLRLFGVFGYEYVLSSSVADVRRTLNSAASAAGDRHQVVEALTDWAETCRTLTQLPSMPERLFIVRDESMCPLAFGCFVRYAGVYGGIALLPGAGRVALDGYARVRKGLRGTVWLDPVNVHEEDGPAKPATSPLQVFARPPSVDSEPFDIGAPDREVTLNNPAREQSVPFRLTARKLPPPKH